MDFIVSAVTDIGLTKSTNQDSYLVRRFKTQQGNVTLAVLCDGMGGLAKGEVASASVINAFKNWSDTRLPQLCESGIDQNVLQAEWCDIAVSFNRKIQDYAKSYGTNMGTTLVAILLTETRFYIINVGDSRAYEIASQLNLDSLKFNTIETLVKSIGLPREDLCLHCFDGSSAFTLEEENK